MKAKILSLCEEIEPEVIAIRRALHQIPEPAFDEHKTQARVCSYLKRRGVAYEKVAGTTGVIGLIKGSGRETVALRADMDALNIAEQTGLSFASTHAGHMHACGHDAHMAIMIGAGIVLKRLGKDLPGQVRLIFQPGEETPPGGALAMIRHGVLRRPRVGAIIATHVDPAIRSGRVAVNSGVISASADDFTITIEGKGGHGSSPHKAVDAIVVAAHLITQLQTITSRRIGPLESAVVSIGKIAGGDRSNVVADRVEMEGTIRTKSAHRRRQIRRWVKKMLVTTCSAFGARGKFDYIPGYPAVYCDERLSSLVSRACSDILGRSRTVTSPGLEMGGEDFAYYAQQVPGTMIFIGVGNAKKGKIHHLHHSEFDIDEDALRVGVAAVAYSAYRHLAERAGTSTEAGKARTGARGDRSKRNR
jgi:amidohydrolase